MKTKGAREVQGSRPKNFHPNSACVAYSIGECDFIVNNIFTPTTKRKIKANAERRAAYLQDPKIPLEYELSPSYYYRDQIARCCQWNESGDEQYTNEVGKYVMAAVTQFGVDALQLNRRDKFRIHPLSREEIAERMANFNKLGMEYLPPASAPSNKETTGTLGIKLKRLTNRKERSPEEQEDSSAGVWDLEKKPERRNPLDYLHPWARAKEEAELRELRWREGLGSVICNVLRFWREQVERGTPTERQQAIKHLKAFGKALVPEARGKRQNTRTASAYEVKKFYLTELYRLYHVEHAVGSYDGPRNFSLKVKQASENYGLAIESIREFLGLDEDDKPDRQRFTPKDMARELAARKFKITHPTVSNLLSS